MSTKFPTFEKLPQQAPEVAITIDGQIEPFFSRHVALFEDDELSIKIGALTALFSFNKKENGESKFRIDPDRESLTMRFTFDGPVPIEPTAVATIDRFHLGCTLDQHIYVTWRVSRLNSNSPMINLCVDFYRSINPPVKNG